MIYQKAILLIGPTGSGKTPLGDICQQRRLWGNKCFHFDFGEKLRGIAQSKWVSDLLEAGDLKVVSNAIASRTLLEKNSFHIAGIILQAFIKENAIASNDLILLNGLPRHISQAQDMDFLVDVAMVLQLECSHEVIHERIRLNTGGDRSERRDDSPGDIKDKLRLYNDRTLPLINYYKLKNVPVIKLDVKIGSTPSKMHQALEMNDEVKKAIMAGRSKS